MNELRAGSRRRFGGGRAAIPSPDIDALHRPAKRARIVQLVLVLGLLALLPAAVGVASDLEARQAGIFPRDTSVVVALDLSQSVGGRSYRRMRATFERLVARDAPVGLIAFSDTAYELLPPGSPASGLRSLVRLFTPVRGRYPKDPWGETFRSGTRISAGLQLARETIRRDNVDRATIVLISDLQTAPSDVAQLGRMLVEMRASSIPVRIIPLFPSADTRFFFEHLLGKRSFVSPEDLTPKARAHAGFTRSAGAPVALLAIGGGVLTLLAAYALWCSRLTVKGVLTMGETR